MGHVDPIQAHKLSASHRLIYFAITLGLSPVFLPVSSLGHQRSELADLMVHMQLFRISGGLFVLFSF